MKLFLPLFILALSFTAYAQKTVSELKPAHAIALEKFLSAHKNYEFMSETVIDAEALKYMRQTWGKTFHPYYAVGDFNKDKVIDFALILARKGEPKKDEDGNYSYPLSVIVFNGGRSGFQRAFLEDVEWPLNCLLTIQEKKLQFGIDESDAGFILTPVGKGYIKEYGEEP